VLARLAVLDVGVAAVAALPTLFLGELVGAHHISVLRAIVVVMLGVAAGYARVVAVRAPRDTLGVDDVFGSDEYTALWPAAVYSVGCVNVPFDPPLAVFPP
jgi:hypothetical protein